MSKHRQEHVFSGMSHMYEINNTAYIVQLRIKICNDILTGIKI